MKRNTSGKDWLYHSMVAFNGSGYADKTSVNSYIKSYHAYKYMKKDKYALKMIEQNHKIIFKIAEFCLTLKNVNRKPSEKQLAKFNIYY